MRAFGLAVWLLSIGCFAHGNGIERDSLRIDHLLDSAMAQEEANPEGALALYSDAFRLSEREKYGIGAFKALQYSGIVHSSLGRYDSALVYYQRALPYSRKSNYERGEAVTFTNMANAYQFLGDYDRAVPLYLESIKIFEHIKDSSTVSESYKNLSALYSTIDNLSLEEHYLKKAILFANPVDHEKMGILYGNYGLFHIRKNGFAKALDYFSKAKALSEKTDSHTLSFYATRNLGEYYNHAKQYAKAIPYYEQALALTEKMHDAFQKSDLLYILSGLYQNINDNTRALEYGLQAYQLAEEINAKEILYRTQKRLAGIYSGIGQPDEAYRFLAMGYLLRDSVLNESHVKQISLMQTRFETEKKDRSIAEQQVKLKDQEVELLAKRNQAIFSLIVIMALAASSIGGWLFFRQRHREKDKQIQALRQKQEIDKLEALIDGEEQERRRIAQELHDGINGELSAIKFRLASLEEAGLGQEDNANLLTAIEMVDNSCAQIRSISHNLMPTSITDFGLVETIRQYCLKINQSNGLRLEFQSFGDAAALSSHVETVIYRIIQELINNIVKHARATTGMVQLNFHEHHLSVTVEDDGVGFDPNAAEKGLGLANVRARVAFLRALLEVDSHGGGTSFHIAIDLNALKHD